MNAYFQHENLDAFTTARSADVNALGQGVEAGFDKLPAEDRFNRTLVDPVTAGGSANVITVALDPAITVYELGQRISFIAAHDNTGAVTVNVNGVGAVELVREDGASLEADDLSAGSIYDAIYNGSDFQLLRGTGGQLAGYVAAAEESAEAAEDSATAAAISAGGASGSASMAMSYANQADAAKDDALAAQAGAEAAQSAAETAEGNAASDAASASASAGAAAASELAASGSASDAAASETAAAGSALAASGSASAADASATDAENAKTAAEAAQTAAEIAQAGAEAAQGGAEDARDIAVAAAATVNIPTLESGRFLSNDGDDLIWVEVPASLPGQSGHSGKFLTTNGSAASWAELAISNVASLQSALDDKAPLASPALTGNPTAPTQSAGNNSTRIATTAYVDTAVAGIVDSAPGTLDTLNELAAALGDDPNFATTMTNALAGKQPLDADLTAIAALTSAANKLLYATGSGTWALSDVTSDARSLLAQTSFANMLTTLGAAKANAELSAIVAVFDGGGSALTARSLSIHVPFACTVEGWTVTADQSGSAVVDVKRATYSGFPTTSSIAGTEKPTLSTAQKAQDNTLSTWTTGIAADDVLLFDMTSVSTCTQVVVALKVRKT